MIIVGDTSAIHAAFDNQVVEHPLAVRVMEEEMLAISPLVLTELDHLAQRDLGWAAAMSMQEAINERILAGQYRLADLRPEDLMTAYEIRSKYEGLALDLADAIGVVLADRYQTNQMFTLDQRGFRAISPLTAKFDAFRILPADL